MNYDKVWGKSKIRDPSSWQSWDLLKGYFVSGRRFLEIGPGNNPRIPIRGSFFVETSLESVEKLNSAGGEAVWASAEKLPWKGEFSDLVCAFEVMEHIKEDEKAFSEVYRVLRKNGVFVFSTPLFKKYWSAWDKMAGHKRRYEPVELEEKLKRIGFLIEKFYSSGGLVNSLFFLLRKTVFNYLFQRPVVFIARNLPSFSLAKINNLYLFFSLPFKQMKLGQGKFSEIKNHNQVIVFCRKKGEVGASIAKLRE